MRQRIKPAPKPLNDASMRSLALFYVGRYSTTQSALVRYLKRKLRERGWEGEQLPALDDLAKRFAELGYVDDRAVAESKTRGLKYKGLGTSRIKQKLGEIGITQDMAGEFAALEPDEAERLALRLAQRRRIGPFSTSPPRENDAQRWMGVMLRAGHDHLLSRSILALGPEEAQNKLNAQD